MSREVLSEEQIKFFNELSDKWNAVTKSLSDIGVLLTENSDKMNEQTFEHLFKILGDAEEIVQKMPYYCAPQPEWLGGDKEVNAYCYRVPHIWRG